MTSQPPAQSGEISGTVLFYSQPEPLSVERHGRLGLRPLAAPYAFAAGTNVVPLQVGEFGPASLSYPVIFAGEQKTPMAVTGLKQGENLFVELNGTYDIYSYIPAFVRRYPFVLANNEDQSQLVVCIDRAAPMLAVGGETPLFVNGQLSPFAQQAVNFCSEFEGERQRTEQFCARLQALDLFETKQVNYTPRLPDGAEGEVMLLADYYAVSEEKLAALSDEVLRELHVNGALRQIHAHLNSMFNWERLIGRAGARNAAAAASPIVGHA